jgi:hypothetical protein
MTIEEVMSLVNAHAKAVHDGNDDACADTHNELREAIRALRDAETEDCALVCEDFDACSPKYLARAIRARIVARRGEA